jgi:hypothetical protein
LLHKNGSYNYQKYMNRTPPIDVRRTLRREVGFGCPVPNCGSPYLEWHHFDPPWRERNHHEPTGMIALCREHHSKADAGTFTKEQLHQFKNDGASNNLEIKGKFDWLRNRLLLVAGGNFYYETLTILKVGDMPIIWLRRDENGYLLLNFRMLTTVVEPRLWLEDNCWVERGIPEDFECPPSGKLIYGKYSNGDEIKIEFLELQSQEAAKKRYPDSNFEKWTIPLFDQQPGVRGKIQFPITAVEISNNIAGTDISFTPTKTTLGGGITITGCFSAYTGCAFSI